MALVLEDKDFQHILRILNTNVLGKHKVMYALTKIKGVGRRFSNMVCKRAQVPLEKRAGELNDQEIEIPKWFLNRQKDPVDGKYEQLVANLLDSKFREDITGMKKIRLHRGLRHHWQVKVRGQHTKTTGRRGK